MILGCMYEIDKSFLFSNMYSLLCNYLHGFTYIGILRTFIMTLVCVYFQSEVGKEYND